LLSPTELDLQKAGVATVLWATGYRRRYPWLQVPVLDERGEIVHHGGITPAAGLYVLGLNFQRTRKSSFIDGVGNDARILADHIQRYFHRSSIAA
jgi:putative flavoprotein involved in K+ transport